MASSGPTPLRRHRSSLEGVLDFSVEPPLSATQRLHAERRFYQIVNHVAKIDKKRSEYNRPLLVSLTYKYASPVESKDNFLRVIFDSMALSIDSEDDIDFSDKELEADLHLAIVGFADYLFENFFLPLKASTRKTPQPSPAYHSAVQRVQGGSLEFVGTPDRVSALRGACLIRDRHRCVISQAFDQAEAKLRFKRDGNKAQDNDGALLLDNTKRFDILEVAHILPHSLTKMDENSQLNPSKKAALDILNMFDNGIIHLLEGVNIDRPYNAITLTHGLHDFFGNFEIFFQAIQGQAHTYRIDSFLHASLVQPLDLPLTRTLYLTEDRSIDPPLPRLLGIHCAIAHILHLSAAGDYIDKLLRDMWERGIQEDGSTELGHFVKLGLGGWFNGAVDTCH